MGHQVARHTLNCRVAEYLPETMEIVLQYVYGGLLQPVHLEMDFNAQLDLYEAFKFLLLDDACSIFLKSVQTALSNRSARVQNLSLLRKPSDQVLIDITIQGIPEELKELFTTVDSDWRRGSPIANSLTLKNLVMCQSRLWRSVDGVCREPDPSQLANGMAVLGHWYDMRGGVPPEDGQTILEVIMNLFVGV